ncbi:MAG: hypothetical protein KGJ84_15305 [Elusimicrobia bacterium]|nr:hypothetical protein [Elusimicrobiota bacterium]
MEKVVLVVPSRSSGRDVAYWLSRPVAERLSAVETLREQSRLFSGKGDMPRMEKVVRVADRRR